MFLLRKVFLFSASLIFGVHTALGTYNDSDEEKEYESWRGRYSNKHKLNPDVPTSSQAYHQTFTKLQKNEKPLAYQGEVYVSGAAHKETVGESKREDIAFVGSTHMNYIQRNEADSPTYEAFGILQDKDAKIDKGAYSRHHQPEFLELYSLQKKEMVVNEKRSKRKLSASDTELIFDPGHGIDHAITITDNGSNSTADARNYTPQNAYYNRHIRNPLVQFAEEKDYSYKELAIYPEEPLLITRISKEQRVQQPIPEGFIFILINRKSGEVEESYYFPNFHHYNQELQSIKQDGAAWKFFAKKYTIDNQIYNLIWGHSEIANENARRGAQHLSEHVGYRALSGRFEILPEEGWPRSARNALIRTSAIYKMQRAAEFDKTTENMLENARLLNNKNFRYLEFEGTLYSPHLASYWTERAFDEVKRKNYPADDIFYFIQYEDGVPLKAEMMPHLISSFETQLKQTPNAEHIVKFLEYFDDKKEEEKYREWSNHLSQIIRQSKVSGSALISEHNITQLEKLLSDTSIINIVIDFEVNPINIKNIIEGLKQRAINEKSLYERNLNFIEFSNISFEEFSSIMESFEYGILHNDEELFIDVSRTAIKLPKYTRQEVQAYVRKEYPQTHVTILD